MDATYPVQAPMSFVRPSNKDDHHRDPPREPSPPAGGPKDEHHLDRAASGAGVAPSPRPGDDPKGDAHMDRGSSGWGAGDRYERDSDKGHL